MPEFTKTDDASQPFAVPIWAWVALAFLVLLVYFSGLTVPLMGPDEPRYAQVAREMYERGAWLTPTLDGYPWFEKPPLLYWLQIVSYHTFGVSEFAARLGPALCGLGTISVLSLLGKTEEDSRNVGLLHHLMLTAASTLGLIVFSHAAGFDIVLTFTLTAALISFFIYERAAASRPKKKLLSLVCFYLSVGLAILAKGLIGVTFPVAIIGLYYLLSRRWPSRKFLFAMLWGLPLILLIAAPWHIVMYQRYGSEFIDVYFLQHHFERFITNKYLHPQPFYFFFWVLPVMTLPWMAFFLAGMWSAARDIVRGVASPIVLFAISWIIVPLVFFSFSGSKLPGYVVPGIPAAVVLTAVFTFRLVTQSRIRRNVISFIGLVTLSVVGGLLVLCLPRFAEADSVKTLIQAADERGYASSRVLTLHMVSYNAEYYAAGRLLRNDRGQQIMLEGAQLVLEEARKHAEKPVLVLVPIAHVSQLTDYDRVTAEVIRDNGDIAIVAVAAK